MSSSLTPMPDNFSSNDQNKDENQHPLMQALQEIMQTTNEASANPLFMSMSSSDSATTPFQMIQKSLSFLEPMDGLAANHNKKQPGASQFGIGDGASSASTFEKLETVGKFAAML